MPVMPDIKHLISIDRPAADVFPLVSTGHGFAQWWAEDVFDDTGGKVSLVGWSLGGVFARMMASLQPEMVRSVVTLGTPFTGSPRATRAWHIYEKVSGQPSEDAVRRQLVTPTPPVPTTSIFSRTDGVVSWRCSVEQPGAAAEAGRIRRVLVVRRRFSPGF